MARPPALPRAGFSGTARRASGGSGPAPWPPITRELEPSTKCKLLHYWGLGVGALQGHSGFSVTAQRVPGAKYRRAEMTTETSAPAKPEYLGLLNSISLAESRAGV